MPTLSEFVAGFEGKRLTAYLDPVGIPTIGFGATRYATGTPVKLGDVITEAEALRLLEHDLQRFGAAVDRLVTVPLTEGQRMALVSLTYNIGEGALSQSTLLRLLNKGDYAGAAAEFPRWNKSKGRVLPGLVRRRAAERSMFQSHLSTIDSYKPNPSEAPMLPIAAAVASALLPALIKEAPALARMFTSGSEVSERNIEAVTKVMEIAKTVANTDTAEGAVVAIQADPAKAAEFREAVHLNMGDLLSLVERVAALDAKSVAAAREFSGTPTLESPVFVITLIVLGMVALGLGYVLVTTGEKEMLIMIVQALVGFGMAAVGYWLGSSHGSMVKTLQK